jgi:hypothetical protein
VTVAFNFISERAVAATQYLYSRDKQFESGQFTSRSDRGSVTVIFCQSM